MAYKAWGEYDELGTVAWDREHAECTTARATAGARACVFFCVAEAARVAVDGHWHVAARAVPSKLRSIGVRTGLLRMRGECGEVKTVAWGREHAEFATAGAARVVAW